MKDGGKGESLTCFPKQRIKFWKHPLGKRQESLKEIPVSCHCSRAGYGEEARDGGDVTVVILTATDLRRLTPPQISSNPTAPPPPLRGRAETRPGSTPVAKMHRAEAATRRLSHVLPMSRQWGSSCRGILDGGTEDRGPDCCM